MDVDPIPEPDEDDDPKGGRSGNPTDRERHRLNSAVAVTVALLASFMAVCKVKDDNIVQAMQQAQADRVDHWSYYQAHNIRLEIARAAKAELEVARATAPAGRAGEVAGPLARYDSLIQDQLAKKDSVRRLALSDQAAYDSLNYRDDQFDLSDALLALAISLLALTALTHRRWLYYVALVPTGFGALMGLAGLLGWHLHSDVLARLLS